MRVRRSGVLAGTIVSLALLTGFATAGHAQCGQGPALEGGSGSTDSAATQGDVVALTCVYSVSVTPDGSTTASWTTNTSGHTATFGVTNTGSSGADDSYSFTCTGSGGVTCTAVNPPSKALSAGATTTVTATYSVGGTPGTGKLILRANGGISGFAKDTGYYNVPIVAQTFDPVAVTPDGGSTPILPANTGGTAAFTVQNLATGVGNTIYTLTCSAVAPVSCTTTNLGTVTVARGTSASVGVSYAVGAASATPGKLTLTASATGVSDNGWYSVLVPGATPTVALAGIPGDNEDVGRCAASCFQAAYAFSTVPYMSLGAPRSVALVYRQDRATPRPFVHVDVQDLGATTPQKFWLQARLNGVQLTFVNGEQTLKFTGSDTKVRLGGQFDASGYTTGLYTLAVTVSSEFSGGNVLQNSVTTPLLIVNEQSSAIARGWTLGGIQRLQLLATGAVLTDGLGSALYFTNCGSCDIYNGPTGELSRLQVIREDPPEPGFPGQVIGYERVFADSTRVIFDLQGRMTGLRDAFGHTTSITYDGSGRVWKITDPMSRTITLTYNANGLSNIQDPGGRNTVITVDASPNRRLTQIADPDGKTTALTYDASFRLKNITDRRGFTRKLGYGSGWALTRDTLPTVPIFGAGTQSPITQLSAWQAKGVPFSATATTAFIPPGADTVYGRITEPGGAVTRFTVNRWGQPLQATDAAGNVSTVAYDTRGLPVKTVLPTYTGGAADTVLYSGSLPIWVRPAGQPATNIRYAGFAQPDSIWGDTLRPAQGFLVGSKGQVLRSRVAGIERQRLHYDLKGRVDSVYDAAGVLVTWYHYEATHGNVDSAYTPGGFKTSYTYDVHGRPTTVKTPGLSTQLTYYSAINRVDSVKATNGASPRVVKYTYDSVSVSGGYAVDKVTDPKGQVYRFQRNAVGWLTERKDPAGASDRYAYSIDGDLRQWTNRRSQTVTTTYDVLHRPLQRQGSDTVTWTYSAPASRTVTATNSVSSTTTYANIRGQPDSVKTVLVVPGQASKTYWQRYRYNSGTLLDSLGVSGGASSYLKRTWKYQKNIGTLRTLTVGTKTTTLGVNTNFQDSTIVLPAGDVVDRTFSPLQIPNERTSPAASTPYNGTTDRLFGYTSGPRLERQMLDGLTIFGRFFVYDSLGQLTKVDSMSAPGPLNRTECLAPPLAYECESGGEPAWQLKATTSFSYDAAGNRTDNGGTYAAGNRITAFGGCTYAADADGNVTSRSSCGNAALNATFEWTRENRLRKVTVGSTVTQFRYGPDGELVRVDLGSTPVPSRYFLWDGPNLFAELDATASAKLVEYSYYPGLDNLHALIRNDSLFMAHADGLGNPIALTDPAKAVKRTYGFDHWGRPAGGTDNGSFNGDDRTRWKGALRFAVADELYYMRARWYEPQTGRFLSEDPAGGGALNRYSYAANDPVNARDPEGLCTIITVNWGSGATSWEPCSDDAGSIHDENHCWGAGTWAQSRWHCQANIVDEVGGSGTVSDWGREARGEWSSPLDPPVFVTADSDPGASLQVGPEFRVYTGITDGTCSDPDPFFTTPYGGWQNGETQTLLFILNKTGPTQYDENANPTGHYTGTVQSTPGPWRRFPRTRIWGEVNCISGMGSFWTTRP